MRNFDKRRRGPRQSAVFAVNQTQFPLKFKVFDRDQAEASGYDVVLRKTGADYRSSEARGNELLDQRNTAQLHRDAQPVAEGIENAFENLASRSRFRKDQWHLGYFRQRNHFLARERMARLNHQLQFVTEHAHHTQRSALHPQRDYPNINRSPFGLLDDLR